MSAETTTPKIKAHRSFRSLFTIAPPKSSSEHSSEGHMKRVSIEITSPADNYGNPKKKAITNERSSSLEAVADKSAASSNLQVDLHSNSDMQQDRGSLIETRRHHHHHLHHHRMPGAASAIQQPAILSPINSTSDQNQNDKQVGSGVDPNIATLIQESGLLFLYLDSPNQKRIVYKFFQVGDGSPVIPQSVANLGTNSDFNIEADPSPYTGAPKDSVVTFTPSAVVTSTPSAVVTSTPNAAISGTSGADVTSTPSAVVTSTPSAVVTSTPNAAISGTSGADVTSTPNAGSSGTSGAVAVKPVAKAGSNQLKDWLKGLFGYANTGANPSANAGSGDSGNTGANPGANAGGSGGGGGGDNNSNAVRDKDPNHSTWRNLTFDHLLVYGFLFYLFISTVIVASGKTGEGYKRFSNSITSMVFSSIMIAEYIAMYKCCYNLCWVRFIYSKTLDECEHSILLFLFSVVMVGLSNLDNSFQSIFEIYSKILKVS
ncbi:hypothetical protein DFJ63DRAFT_314779 [Scheffersomyces coipomensis]|uniref:uncharacterized protein n=1 Tax=Scheffersomyces coipomensis TaxID=1788519 RepID=UPI00315C9842